MDQLTYLEALYGNQMTGVGIHVMESSTLVLAPGNIPALCEIPPFLLDHAPFQGEE